MNPEDIQNRDFFVGLRGYDRDEVHTFLAEVAAEHAALLDEVHAYRNNPLATTPPVDPIAELGASVTAVLRTANDQAEQIAAQAREAADESRREAEEHATHLRQEAAEYAAHIRREAEDDAGRIRAEATQTLERAHEQATRILREADEAVERIEADAERRGRERALERADAEVARLADAGRRHEELRARLAEANDELSLA